MFTSSIFIECNFELRPIDTTKTKEHEETLLQQFIPVAASLLHVSAWKPVVLLPRELPRKNKEFLYCLDFDGVLCDSNHETFLSGWRACKLLWNDKNNTCHSDCMDAFENDMVLCFTSLRRPIKTMNMTRTRRMQKKNTATSNKKVE